MSVEANTRHVRLPILQGLLPLDLSQLPREAVAGATLAALAIPEVMGYTRIAGTPVVTGLYTLLIPMALFSLFGSSRHLVVGADSATAAIMASGFAGLAAPSSPEWLALAELAALLVGVLLLIARVVRLGFLADFLSRTVLVGFLTGVGIQVALGEVPGLFGLEAAGHGPIGKLVDAAEGIGQARLPVVLVALAVILVIVGARRLSRRIPGALIAVVGAIAASWALDLRAHGVSVLGPVPSGVPEFGLPHVAWSLQLVERLLPTAAVVVLVGVEQGILAAMVLSLLAHVRRGYRPKNVVLVEAKGAPHPEPVATKGELRPGLVAYRFNHSMYYANATQLSEEVSALARDARPKPRWFCFDMTTVDDVDYTAAETLISLLGRLRAEGIRPVFAEVTDAVRAELDHYGTVKLVGADAIYDRLGEVISAYTAEASPRPRHGAPNHA